MSKKLFLLDALALIYRAYYALIRTPRITSTGINTNAQFGFTNTLLEIIRKENPSHIAVCFDTHAPTERHTDFADYKANRQETPEDLLDSLPHIKAIIEGFNIPVSDYDGYEAVEIIGPLGWLAGEYENREFNPRLLVERTADGRWVPCDTADGEPTSLAEEQP